MKRNFDRHHGVKEKTFKTDDPVYARTWKNNKEFWEPGTVKARNKVMYDVEVRNQTTSRHANQLKPRYTQIHHRPEQSCNGFMLAFDLPLPRKRPTVHRGERPREGKKPVPPTLGNVPVPEGEVPIFVKIESMVNHIRSLEGQTLPPEARDELMESIAELEKEFMEADNILQSNFVQALQQVDTEHLGPEDVSELFKNLTILSAASGDTPRGSSPHRDTNNETICEELSQPGPSNADDGLAQIQPGLEVLPVRRKLFEQIEAETNIDSDPLEAAPARDLDRSVFDDQDEVQFPSPEEFRLAPASRVRKKPFFLEVTHTKSPRYKSRKLI